MLRDTEWSGLALPAVVAEPPVAAGSCGFLTPLAASPVDRDRLVLDPTLGGPAVLRIPAGTLSAVGPFGARPLV